MVQLERQKILCNQRECLENIVWGGKSCFKATSKRINNAILLQGRGSAGFSTANKTKERHNPQKGVIQKHQTFNHLAWMCVQGPKSGHSTNTTNTKQPLQRLLGVEGLGQIRLKTKKKPLDDVCGCTSEEKVFILSRKVFT